jgi:hypothetical protein
MVNNLVMRPPSLSGVVSPMKAKATSFLNTLCHAHSEREREREKRRGGRIVRYYFACVSSSVAALITSHCIPSHLVLS